VLIAANVLAQPMHDHHRAAHYHAGGYAKVFKTINKRFNWELEL
jgi:hypothetical protein